jgi:hypothetical protein
VVRSIYGPYTHKLIDFSKKSLVILATLIIASFNSGVVNVKLPSMLFYLGKFQYLSLFESLFKFEKMDIWMVMYMLHKEDIKNEIFKLQRKNRSDEVQAQKRSTEEEA